jgi:hypothetical protein
MYYCFQQFAAERVMTSKHNSEITKKDKEIQKIIQSMQFDCSNRTSAG